MVRNESRFPGEFHANCGKNGTFGRSSQADRDQPIRLKLFADLVEHQLVLLSQVQFPVDHHRMRPAVSLLIVGREIALQLVFGGTRLDQGDRSVLVSKNQMSVDQQQRSRTLAKSLGSPQMGRRIFLPVVRCKFFVRNQTLHNKHRLSVRSRLKSNQPVFSLPSIHQITTS